MAKTQSAAPDFSDFNKIVRLHFFLIGLYGLQILVFDAWDLITAEALVQRWVMSGVFLIVLLLLWYASRFKTKQERVTTLLWLLITADIAFASLNVFIQRGMASRAVVLYALPIIVAAAFKRGTAIIGVAVASAVMYFLTAQAYFILYFNEGYKIELYGEAGFYSVFLLLLAGTLSLFSKSKQ